MAIRYELFVRNAFGYKLGKEIQRAGDPKGLADADLFNNSNIQQVKTAVVDSMRIYIDDIIPKKQPGIDERKSFNKIIIDVEDAPNIKVISKLIETFSDEVIDKYYNLKQGILIIK